MRRNSLPLNAVVARLPTPCAGLAKTPLIRGRAQSSGVPFQSLDRHLAVTQPERIGQKLNPQFVAWLMGFPEGWLD